MIVLWIVLAVLLVLILAGLGLLYYICVRHRQPDMTDPDWIAHSRLAAYQDEVLAGINLIRQGGAEDIYLRSYDDLRLHGQLLQQPNAKGTLLLFHGYRSGWPVDFSISLPYYYSLGYNLLVVDQRAHGQSEGTYIAFGVQERHDAVTWAEYAAMHFGPEHPLFLGGLSMGATSVLMAAGLKLPASVRGIIADCGFTSPAEIMKSVLHAHCKWLPAAPLLAFVNIFTTLFAGFSLKEASTTQALAAATLPVLLIHGTSDSFVPACMSQQAYDACASQKELVLVDGADHGCSYLVDRTRVQAALAAFLQQHTTKEEHT